MTRPAIPFPYFNASFAAIRLAVMAIRERQNFDHDPDPYSTDLR
jgi:hypothetical protein